MQKIYEHLKRKWGINTVWDFVLINIVFALAGACIVFERKPIFELIGIQPETALWIKVLAYIPIVIPLYQVNLLVFSFLLGQFPFFWEKEKKMAQFVSRSFCKIFN